MMFITLLFEHLPKGFVQINELNTGIFWFLIPGYIAVATYAIVRYGKEIEDQLNELIENK